MAFSTIKAVDGWTYKFTNDDWLWAIRMLVGEAGKTNWTERWKQMEGEAILWSMFNRLYLLRNTYSTYTNLILAYSQPINPIWRAGGRKCVANPGNCDLEAQQRRAFFAAMQPEQAPPEVVALVTRFMQGKVPGDAYAGLAHFIAPGEAPAPEAIGPVAIPGMQARSNVFFKVAPTLRWPPPSALFMFKSSTTHLAVKAGLALVAVGVVIVYWRWSKAQR